MLNKVYIKHIDTYIPETRLVFESIDYADYQHLYNSKNEFIDFTKSILNLDSIRIENEKSYEDMVLELVKKNIDDRFILTDKINLVIIASNYEHISSELDKCKSFKKELEEIDVDEIVCFIDFGLPKKEILDSLKKFSDEIIN